MESRYDGESHYSSYGYYPSYSYGESRSDGESHSDYSYSSSNSATNVTITQIDQMISRLKVQPKNKNKSERIKAALSEREKRIEALKQLRKELIAKDEEEEYLQSIEDTNKEIDELIDSIRLMLK